MLFMLFLVIALPTTLQKAIFTWKNEKKIDNKPE